MNTLALRSATLALALLAGATLGAENEDADALRHRLLVSHAWNSPSEVAALKAVVDLFVAKYPDTAVSLSPVQRDPENLLPQLSAWVKEGRAPEACYAHDGYGADVYVDAGLFQPIDEIWAREHLDALITPALHGPCQIDGHYYVVPIGLHRVNLIWYNQPLLAQNGIEATALTTWPKLFEAAERLRKKGVARPIVLGESWTLIVVFQSMVASVGLDVYERWVNGKITGPADPKMLEAFRLFGRYLDYVNDDYAGLAWDKALQRIASGQAAFFLMGDWANGEFRVGAGKTFGKDYGVIPAPGTKGLYGVVVDGFALPRGVASPENAERWLRLVASREGQDVFNVRKGSIPARSDADVSLYDAYQKSAISDLKKARVIFPAMDEAVPDAVRAKHLEALLAFAHDRDARKAVALFAQASSSLATEYKRTWSFR